MLNNLKIGTKVNLLLILVFIISILVTSTTLSTLLQHRAQNEVTSKAIILMHTMNSVRKYTQYRINPLLKSKLETETQFIPETVPAFSAIKIFEDFRKDEKFKNFIYREAAINPTNLRDKADSFETKIIQSFRKNPKNQEITGFRNLPQGEIFYIARPLAITQPSCLECHSTIDKAPKSLLASYGTKNGFGWQLNEIVAAQIISVPSQEVFEDADHSWSMIMGLVIAIFALVILLLNLLIKRAIVQRIKAIEKIAQQVSVGNMSIDFDEKYNDEIGGLGVAFNRMKASLQIAINLLEKNDN
ncbi:MAG: histidine kinase [Hapalosiphonaceae cyanobacterium JJU2]|nr:MAG: histidine kinase [Hapalosiphonaceae cyanobacterium JJU2]